MTQRRSHYGNIRRLPSGRYQARVTVDGRLTPLGTFATRREATAAVGHFDTAKRVTENSPEVTLAELTEQWWATRSGHRPSTRARDRVALDHDIVPSFGDRVVQGVTHSDVQRWVNSLAERVSPATVRRTFVVLAQLFELAEDHGLGTSPARRVRLPRIEREEMRFLTPAELDRLADAVGIRWRAMVLLMAFATLRIGEATGLRRRDLDPLHRRVQIANNIVEVGHERHEGPPKTRAGRRTMTLPKVVAAVVTEHLERFAGESYLFPWDDGGPLRAEEWRRTVWRPAITATGLAPLRPHDLKHTGVAFLVAAGVDPSEIARRAGHFSAVAELSRSVAPRAL